MEFLQKLKIRMFLIVPPCWVTVSIFLWVSVNPINQLNAAESSAITVNQAPGNILRFKHISIEDGLSTSEVRSFAQDNTGFMWLATPAGLNRYDGHSIKPYTNNPLDKNSLSTNVVNRVLSDYQGQIWVATDKGLNRYQPETDSFVIYRHDDTTNSISNDSISALYEDSQQNLWVGTRFGLNRYNRESNDFTRYLYDEKSNEKNPSTSLRQGKINVIYEDSAGLIWIGTTSGSIAKHRGISVLNPKTNQFTHFDHLPNDNSSLQEGSVMSFFETNNQQLWVVTNEGGLSQFLPSSGKFRRINFATDNSKSDFKEMNGGLVDAKGNIWLMTTNEGLLRFNHHRGLFQQYKNNAKDQTSISGNNVHSIYEDRDNLLWIGTVTSGANTFDYRTEFFNHQLPHEQLENFNNSSIRTFYEVDSSKVYIGSSINHMIAFDPTTNIYKKLYDDKSNNTINRRATGLSKDKNGTLLLGTNRGFYIINPKNDQRQYIPLAIKNTEKIVNIVKTFVSKDGTYWLASAGTGLFSYVPGTNKITHFPFSTNNAAFDQYSLSSYYPRDILEDSQGYLWIATIRGLNRFDRKTKTFKHYLNDPNDDTSLPENKIFQIIEDNDNAIWLATNNGLILFNKLTERFRRFSTEDGLAIACKPVAIIYGLEPMMVLLAGTGTTIQPLTFIKRMGCKATNLIPTVVIKAYQENYISLGSTVLIISYPKISLSIEIKQQWRSQR